MSSNIDDPWATVPPQPSTSKHITPSRLPQVSSSPTFTIQNDPQTQVSESLGTTQINSSTSTSINMWSREQLAEKLFDAGAVRLGDIEAMEGRMTPIYFDLRVVVSHPTVMMAVALHVEKLAAEIKHDILCGVPYAALPITAVMSVNTGTPMIMKRKEPKLYATKKILEGIFQPKQKCLVVEDVVTSGGSLLETVGTLRDEGLTVTDAVIVLEREQGGASVLKRNGIAVHSLFTMSELVKMLKDAGRITDETVEMVSDHIKVCQFGVGDNLEIAERIVSH